MKSAKAEGLKLRAAIYARKSTDDSERSDDLKSVALQVASARQFAVAQGFKVIDEHIYIDDNISGARISRPALDRLMAALGISDGRRQRRGIDPHSLPFDVLIVRDQSRLIRNSDHATRIIKKVVRSGVQLWYYKDRHRVTLGFAEELTIGMQGHMDSRRRIEASQDAREALSARAQKGYNSGGCCYGYTNVPVTKETASGSTVKLYTDYVINEEQADVLRRIFRMYADGFGPRRISKALNGDPRYADESRKYFEGRRHPKLAVGERGTGSWAPTAIRAMLRNERYTGIITFGRMKKDYDEDGESFHIKQPDPTKIIRTERADLRIIPAALWKSVQARIKIEEQSYLKSTQGLLHGRPVRGLASKYLLSGFVRCGVCGSSMVVSKQSFGAGATRRQVPVYLCGYRSHRGSTACSNSMRPMLDALEQEVLSAIEQQVLKPEVVREAVKQAMEMRRASVAKRGNRPAELRREIAQCEAEQARLVAAIRLGGALASLVAELASCEQQGDALRRELDQIAGPKHIDELSAKRTEKQFTERLNHWRELLANANPATARDALRTLMPVDAPIVFMPEAGGYRLSGATRIGSLFGGSEKVATPRGFEPRLPP